MSEKRWEAVKNNDQSFDGTFYYGVKTTGIFCLPSCKSKAPLKENVIFFDSFEQALKTGFRPCKRCRPDIYPTYTPNEELLLKIRNYLDEHSDDPKCLNGLDVLYSISKFHLIRIFKSRFGKTPREYVQNKRLETAKKQLISSDMKIIDIAFNCGFSSYTSFFTNFKNITGMTPDEFRKWGGGTSFDYPRA